MATFTDYYYKYREPTEPSHQDFELAGLGYRGFILARDSKLLLWTVEMDDGSLPPVELRGAFTSKTLAEKAIDGFIEKEQRLQEQHNKK